MEPKYTITNELVKHLGNIEAAKTLIENAPLVPLWERQFRQEAIVRAAHHATHVEGNPLSLKQAQKIVDGREVSAKERDIKEIINYRKVIEYIDNVYQDISKPITEETVLEIHKILMNGLLPPFELGKYRTVQVSLRNIKTGEVVLLPPKASDVPKVMQDFLRWLWKASSEGLNPVIKAGIIHYEFVAIHPFTDGDGRTARALSTLSLYKDRYDIKRFFCLDEYFDQDIVSYYVALKSADVSYDLTPWLEYFAAGLSLELEKIKERVVELSRDAKLKKTIGQIALNERQEKIILFVENHERITNKDWRRLFPNISDDTLLRDIKFLIKKRILNKKGKTKSSSYELR